MHSTQEILDNCWKQLCSGLFRSSYRGCLCDSLLLTVHFEMAVYCYYYYYYYINFQKKWHQCQLVRNKSTIYNRYKLLKLRAVFRFKQLVCMHCIVFHDQAKVPQISCPFCKLKHKGINLSLHFLFSSRQVLYFVIYGFLFSAHCILFGKFFFALPDQADICTCWTARQKQCFILPVNGKYATTGSYRRDL